MKNKKEDIIFRLRYSFYDGSRLWIDAIHTGEYDQHGTSKITMRAKHSVLCPGDKYLRCSHRTVTEIWSPGDTWCHPSPMHADDSKETKSLVTSLLTTDLVEHRCSPEKIYFCHKYGEELDAQRFSRYGEDS